MNKRTHNNSATAESRRLGSLVGRVCLDVGLDFKPGDLPPDGYLAWHEWAEVQEKAGLKQVKCGKCGLFKYPQELSNETVTLRARTRLGAVVTWPEPVCIKCAANNSMTGGG
jgi:hypothetical protein